MKKQFKKFLNSKVVFIICLFLVVFLGLSLSKKILKDYPIKREVENLKHEIEMLDKQNKEFSKLITYLNSDSFLEKEAKLKLGLKKKGESVVIMPQNKHEIVLNNNIFNIKNENISNFRKWFAYFFAK